MDANQAIITKRDVPEFLPDPVDDDQLPHPPGGRMAGSAKNEQVNRLVVVTEPASGRGSPTAASSPLGPPLRPSSSPPDPKGEPSPRIPLDELVRWGRWSD